ncbi:F-box protein At2g43440-like [Aegilops tauschii subsp. strangulata]|uniref:Uncharacterized protein n=1 Tax=Aegilops tauschii TaxID=37682 RepID=M8CMQ1_AEGTA
MQSFGEELLRAILVKLPTRDLARSACVSRQWRTVVGEPSFRRLHASATHVVSGPPETLAVTEIRGMRIRLEAVVLNVASEKTMCRITDLAGGYVPTNACNGFLCFAANAEDWHVCVCNPVTGDKIKIAPPPENKGVRSRMYAMGFSALTHQYKLFRLSFHHRDGSGHYLDAYTLGGHDGWRRNPHLLPCRASYNCAFPPPVLIDGKLYVLAEPAEYGQASDKIIVIDVDSETHCIHHLPEEFTGAVIAAMHAFNLSGQLCIAIRLAGQQRLRFWVMPPLLGMSLFGSWELRYTFDMSVDDDGRQDISRGAWFDDGDRMLCYRLHDHLYQFDTTNKKEEVDGSMQWDHDIQLPEVPPQEKQRWNVYSGYCPSLVSPRLAFASPMTSPGHMDEQELFEKALVHALRRKKTLNSKKPFPTNVGLPDCTGDERVAKRICEPKQ